MLHTFKPSSQPVIDPFELARPRLGFTMNRCTGGFMRIPARLRSLVLVIFLPAGFAAAQHATASAPPQVDVPAIPPRAEDVATIDGIMKAFYDVISGPAGQPR